MIKGLINLQKMYLISLITIGVSYEKGEFEVKKVISTY